MRWLGLSTSAAVDPRVEAGIAIDAGESPRLPAEVWALAWPAITHMLLVTLVFLVDRLLLGHASASALASLQISSVLVWTAYSVFTAFSTGTLAVAARRVGEGDRDGAARTALSSLAFSVALGGVVTLALLSTSHRLLACVFPDAGEVVLHDVGAYLSIVLPCLPAAFVESSAAAALQAAGDTRTPLRAGMVGNATNLVTSSVLVFGLLGAPRLGIRGAALGAASASVVQAALLLVALFSSRSPLPLARHLAAALDVRELTRLLRVSGPAYLEKLAYNGGYLLFVVVIAKLGEAAMAANQAMVSVEAVCFLSAEGFGVAAAALVAQKLGARRPDEATRVAAIATRMAIGLLSACGLAFALAPRLLMLAFSSDPAIVAMGARALWVTALAQPFMAYAMVLRMSLRGAGATKTVLAVTLVGTFLVRLPVSYWAAVSMGWGLVGVWLGSTLDWVVEGGMLLVVFRRGAWRRARV
jgi:putative MATE family efflux protein